MPDEISLARAIEILEAAFAPFRCVAEAWDYDKKVRFRVFDAADEPLLTFPSIVWRSVSNLDRLSTLISEARRRLESKGMALDTWSMPLR